MIRQNVQFVSQGLKCTGWFYRASSYNNLPCIIMAPGFGGVKEKGLSSYAAAFAEIGYHVLVFDYRHFGEAQEPPDIFWTSQSSLRIGMRQLALLEKQKASTLTESFSGAHHSAEVMLCLRR